MLTEELAQARAFFPLQCLRDAGGGEEGGGDVDIVNEDVVDVWMYVWMYVFFPCQVNRTLA